MEEEWKPKADMVHIPKSFLCHGHSCNANIFPDLSFSMFQNNESGRLARANNARSSGTLVPFWSALALTYVSARMLSVRIWWKLNLAVDENVGSNYLY